MGRVVVAADPFARTRERLRTVLPGFPDVYAVDAGAPAGPGWHRLDAVLADGTVARWCADARRPDGSAAAVAAVRVVGMLAHAVLGRLTAALALDRRAHDVSAANLAVHLDGDGWVDRVAVRDPTVTVLPGDPAAGAPGTVLAPDLPALLDGAAGRAVATLGPVVEQVRAASRFGVVAGWGVAADAVLSTASFVPLYLGRDERAGRAVGTALLDALVAHGARVRTRGGCTTVARAGFALEVPLRGSCCFAYRSAPAVERPGDEYCSTCPVLDPALRGRRLAELVDGHVLPRRAAL